MNSVDEITKSLLQIKEKIKAFFVKFDTEITDKIVNEQESNNLYFELETFVKGCLEEVFGEESDTLSNALSSNFLHYNSLKNINSDGVIFNYWSHKGESIETPIRVVTGQWRDNLYYKGHRWSNEEKKELFYKFFNKIKSALQGDAPVDFFTKYGVECDTRYLKIIGLKEKVISQTTQNSMYRQIAIPILSVPNIQSVYFKSLLSLIFGMKAVNQNSQQLNNFISQNEEQIKQINTIITNAFDDETAVENKTLLNIVKEALITGLTEDDKKKNEIDKGISIRDIFNVIIAYQYYDHPYDIHMFFPASNHGNLYSCLVITVEEASKEIDTFVDSFIELANELGQITALERKIWEQKKENLAIYWRWKKHYEDFADQHRRLSNVVINICLAICRKLKVEVFSVPSRLKEFDSFYNKIVDRANGRDQDYPEKISGKSDTEWLEIRAEKLRDYRAKILDPTRRNAELIFGDLKDIVGLRIVCLYPAEKDKILQEFEDHKDRIQIEHFEKKDYKEPFGYRSTHISFSLGKERCNLYELDDLHDRKCEIQIRTILEQGWADVSHKTLYKPGVPKSLVEKVKNEIKNELDDQANALFNVDQAFDRIVKRVREISKRGT